LSQIIEPGSIELNLKGDDREAVLKELVGYVRELRDLPNAQQSLLEALKERESLHSTGIGDGIALPHARTALVGLVEKPVVVVGRHHAGIHYGSIDDKPVHLFFLLIAPTVTQHLGIIARISRTLRNQKFRAALLEVHSPEEMIELFRQIELEK